MREEDGGHTSEVARESEENQNKGAKLYMNESPSNVRTSWPYYFGKLLSLHVDELRIVRRDKLRQ